MTEPVPEAECAPRRNRPHGTKFSDGSSDYWAASWIEQLVNEGITGRCGHGIYCHNSPVTRAQMAVFLVKTFNLP
ncbi:MAG: hypothetical protein A3K04_05895 [Gallionellales bacterium RBG_16_56_9]|nr:MAG: hypothetical protein A3K04_05895 [Gallionellales bacterium RBG_16_56_9]